MKIVNWVKSLFRSRENYYGTFVCQECETLVHYGGYEIILDCKCGMEKTKERARKNKKVRTITVGELEDILRG